MAVDYYQSLVMILYEKSLEMSYVIAMLFLKITCTMSTHHCTGYFGLIENLHVMLRRTFEEGFWRLGISDQGVDFIIAG